jgi:hypothetical protein
MSEGSLRRRVRVLMQIYSDITNLSVGTGRIIPSVSVA